MEISGNLIKLSSQHDTPVKYFMNLGQEEILLNELIGHDIIIKYHHEINCIACGKVTKTSFFQG